MNYKYIIDYKDFIRYIIFDNLKQYSLCIDFSSKRHIIIERVRDNLFSNYKQNIVLYYLHNIKFLLNILSYIVYFNDFCGKTSLIYFK